jgi:hypothetical protein
VGRQIFFSPQIANPQILRLIPQSQISKYLWCSSPQITNPKISMEKGIVSDPDPHWFASNKFSSYVSTYRQIQ